MCSDLVMWLNANITLSPSLHELNAVQDYLMFLLLVQRPTMRTQNLSLKILAQMQTAKEATDNGIVFTSDHVILQFNQYKTVK